LIEHRLARNRRRRKDQREPAEACFRVGIGPFTCAWGAALIVGVAMAIMVVVAERRSAPH